MAIKVTWKNENGKVESLTASTGNIRAAKVDSSDNPTEKFYYEHNPAARAQLTERADEADKLTTPSASRMKAKTRVTSPMFRQQPTTQQNVVTPKNQNTLAQGLGKGALQRQEAKNYQSESAFNQHMQDVKPKTTMQRVGNTLKGAADDVKHVVSAGAKGSAGSYLGAAGLFNEINAAVGEAVGNLIGNPEKGKLWKEEAGKIAAGNYETGKRLTAEGQAEENLANYGKGPVGKFVNTLGVNTVQMGGDALLAPVAGGYSLIPLAVRAGGSAALESSDSGANLLRRAAYSVGTGGVEALTEKLSDGLAGIYGAGAADEIVEDVVAKLSKSVAGQAVLKTLFSATGEGLEEVISDFAQPALQTIYNGKSIGENYSAMQASDVLYDFLVGAALGGIGGGVEAAANRFARFDNSLGESGRKAIRGSYQKGKDTAEHVKDFIPAYNAGVEGKANPNPTNETAYAGYVAGQNDAKAAAGTGEHIDSRTKENVSGRNVNAFQFDHPELHSYYSAAAEQISGIADISLSRGQQKGARQRTANGYQRNNQIFETPAMRKAMNEGLTRTQIIDAAQRIINDNGQENVKAAKTLEIVLDDMLTNGYTAVDGTAVSPNTDYIAAKQQIAGAEVQATGFDKYVTDNRLALETGEVTMDELRAEYAQQEGAEHGEAVHLRDGSERDNGANPRREVRGVEESTGRDQGRAEGRRFADGEAASLDYGEKVSTASFGIGRGAFNDSVYLVKNETAEMRKAKDLAKERGLRVTFFAGNNLTFRDKSGKTFQVRGYVSGDRVFIRADHPEFTSYQIMRHEAGHDMIARGEVDLNEVRTRIDKTFTGGEIDSLCTAYADAYSGTGMTAQEIWEEVVCDSLGDMNIFADSEISDAAAFLLAHIKVESETVAQESTRAPPSKTASNFDNREVSGNDRTGTHGNGSAVQEGRQDRAGEQAVQGASGTVSRGDALHGRDRGRRDVTPSFGETPVRAWTDGNTVTPGQGAVAYQEQQTAMEYGIPSFVVSDEIWEGAKGSLPGFSVSGQIYLKENIPEQKRGMVTIHEATHIMKQTGFKPYLDFTQRVPEMLDMSSLEANIILASPAKHRNIDVLGVDGTIDAQKLENLNAADRLKLYDELNAILYGHIGSGKLNGLEEYLRKAFYDFDGYASELRGIHDQFKNENSAKRNDAAFSREIPEANYEALKEKYGYIPAGERAYREVQVPKKTADDKYVSRTIRTVLEAKATPDAMVPTLERMVAKGQFSYDRYTDKQAISDAESRIKTEGWQKALNKWKNSTKEGISKENTAIGWALYNNAANSGDVETAIDVLDTIVKRQRNAAQALQATRLLKQQDPGTQLYAAQRSVENLTEDLKKQYGEKAPDLKIDRDLAEEFLNAKDDDARTEAMKEIYRDIGRQMPSRFIDKWNAWRYLSMLGNPRTHVRNIVGNVGFVPAVTVKNVIGAGIESAANAVSGGKVGRTKAILTTKDAGLIKASWSDYANIREQALGSGKYNDNVNVRQEIEEGRTVFKLKPLEAMRKFNGTALDAEDAWFSKPHYAAALAQFCKANGITAEQVAGGKGIGAAREYAIREAQKATYRDTNAFSQMISDLGRYRGDNKMKRLGSTLTEGILPFRKTPANILVRGVEYSPIGFLKSISYDLVQVQKGNMQATEMIDRAAAGLTGTGLMMLGLYMAKEGILRGNGGDDEKKKKFDELQGHQEYALEMPNGTSITLDWLAPEALPFFVGANLYEQMQANNGYLTMSDMLQAASNVTDPLLSMSCLQSLNDVFDAVGYASSGDTNALTSAVASAATSYLTQGIPTILGQAERTGESTRMTTYTDKNKFLTPDMQYALGKASARIPGVDYGQIPFIDAWGRTENSGSAVARAFNNFANPAYTSKVTGSKMEDELGRLYEATGESKVLPQRASKSFVVNKEIKQLTGDEYVKYATKRGQTSYKIVSELTGLASYKAMSDDDKADAVAKAYEYANVVGKMSVSNYQTDGWVAKAIDTVKKTGVSEAQYIALYMAKGDIESLKDRNGDTISNSDGLQIMELVYQQKGLSDKQRAALFEDFGVGKSIRHWNRARVDEQLAIMRKKAT